jgi:lipopolysaccharide/colanic/teichoic acid biosynthesis glycosyltransferase
MSYTRQWKLLIAGLVGMDMLAVWVSLWLAYDVRFTSGLLTYYAEFSPNTYTLIMLIGIPLLIILFAAAGLYKRANLLGGIMEYKQAVKAASLGVLLFVVLSFAWRDDVLISRGWVVFSWTFLCLLLIIERFAMRRLAYALRRRGWLTARALVVGANDQGIAIARQWHLSQTSGEYVIGFVDDFKPIGTTVFEDLKVIGPATMLDQLIERLDVDEVVVVPNAVAWETFEEIIAQSSAAKDYDLLLSPGFYELLTNGVAVTNKSYVPLFTINEARLVGLDALMKAGLDYGLGLVLFSWTLPILGFIAFSLMLTRHSIFSAQPTVGQRGKIFSMHKFNVADDLPAWLRRVLQQRALDKLPQLLNVIKGQMSLVGPRPRVLNDSTVDPRQAHNLQSVKPGMTSPWLVQEFWSSADETQDDLYYIRNWTIWLDLQIIFQSMIAWFSARRPVAGAGETTARIEPAPKGLSRGPQRSIEGFNRLEIKRGRRSAPAKLDR